jgi:hypothetical protein
MLEEFNENVIHHGGNYPEAPMPFRQNGAFYCTETKACYDISIVAEQLKSECEVTNSRTKPPVNCSCYTDAIVAKAQSELNEKVHRLQQAAQQQPDIHGPFKGVLAPTVIINSSSNWAVNGLHVGDFHIRRACNL